MQQHSGEHIVSGILCGLFHCSNVGFHIGHELVTIDFDTQLTPEDVEEVERRANQYIWEDRVVDVSLTRSPPRGGDRRRCGRSPRPAPGHP